jgi:hypothetical protein
MMNTTPATLAPICSSTIGCAILSAIIPQRATTASTV